MFVHFATKTLGVFEERVEARASKLCERAGLWPEAALKENGFAQQRIEVHRHPRAVLEIRRILIEHLENVEAAMQGEIIQLGHTPDAPVPIESGTGQSTGRQE